MVEKNHNIFVNFCIHNSLTQLITESTHCTSGNSLDLLLCNFAGHKYLKFRCISVSLSDTCDHYSINFQVKWVVNSPSSKVLKQNFYEADYESISQALNLVDCSQVIEDCSKNVQQLYDKIVDILLDSISIYVPIDVKQWKLRQPGHISHLLKEKLHLYNESKRNSTMKKRMKRNPNNMIAVLSNGIIFLKMQYAEILILLSFMVM